MIVPWISVKSSRIESAAWDHAHQSAPCSEDAGSGRIGGQGGALEKEDRRVKPESELKIWAELRSPSLGIRLVRDLEEEGLEFVLPSNDAGLT